jgi:hypothetical protein
MMRFSISNMARVDRSLPKKVRRPGAAHTKGLGAFAFPGTPCTVTAIDHAIIARFLSVAVGSADGEAEAQQFADRSRSRRHTVLESEIVEYRQFLRREHDL